MGDTRRPFDYGSRDPDPGTFIQCVDGRETMIQELWCPRIDGICHEVHPTACIDIPTVTIRELVTKYLSANGK